MTADPDSTPVDDATRGTHEQLSIAGAVVRGSYTLAVELEMPPGQVVAVLGPNGAGKTTLLHVLAGLVGLTAGSVRLGDRVLDEPATSVLVAPHERPIAMVFQDYRLFPHLDVLENVAFAPRSRGLSRRAGRRAAAAVLSEFDLTELAERKPATLSGENSSMARW